MFSLPTAAIYVVPAIRKCVIYRIDNLLTQIIRSGLPDYSISTSRNTSLENLKDHNLCKKWTRGESFDKLVKSDLFGTIRLAQSVLQDKKNLLQLHCHQYSIPSQDDVDEDYQLVINQSQKENLFVSNQVHCCNFAMCRCETFNCILDQLVEIIQTINQIVVKIESIHQSYQISWSKYITCPYDLPLIEELICCQPVLNLRLQRFFDAQVWFQNFSAVTGNKMCPKIL